MSDEPTVRVHAEYDCYPTWVHQGEDVENVPPGTLGISGPLAQELDAWADEFDAILDWDNPIDSRFRTPQVEESFVVRGEQLARRLQTELGDTARVVYYHIRKSARVTMK